MDRFAKEGSGVVWDPKLTEVVSRLRSFFQSKGYSEFHPGANLTIMAACEDPKTVAPVSIGGQTWPLQQTSQMQLEVLLLENPEAKGFYCLTTSYRNEPNPTPGRHNRVFPLFEFEGRGDMGDLIQVEKELLAFLGLADGVEIDYEDACSEFGVSLIEAEEEGAIEEKYGESVFLKNFPGRSNPFWNMLRKDDGDFAKVDVLLHGMETIGSAQRSVDVDVMREVFNTVADGEYAQLLFDKFGEERVRAELDEYLELPMVERFGGGIGVTRMLRALELSGLI